MLYYTQLVKKDKRGEKSLKVKLKQNMEKKEGIISFIKQLFSSTPNDKEQIEQANQELDEETKKELEKSYKKIDNMIEKYKVENFESTIKENKQKNKPEKQVEIKQKQVQEEKRSKEQEQDGEERQ